MVPRFAFGPMQLAKELELLGWNLEWYLLPPRPLLKPVWLAWPALALFASLACWTGWLPPSQRITASSDIDINRLVLLVALVGAAVSGWLALRFLQHEIENRGLLADELLARMDQFRDVAVDSTMGPDIELPSSKQ